METLKLKNYLAMILMALTLISCAKGEDKMEIIVYGTPEFTEFEKTAPISLDEAWELQLDFMKKNTDNDFAYSFYKSNVLLFFIADGNYVFTVGHINNKTSEGHFLSGIWINSITGKASENKLSELIEIKQEVGWRKSKDLTK